MGWEKKSLVLAWNRDKTPRSWLKYSVVWVSQLITPQLGYARIKHYLAAFDYGNQDFTGDPGKHNSLTKAWLSSSLKISAVEQLNFLNAMLSNEALENTKQNLYLGKLANGSDYYGKTGSGEHNNAKEKSAGKLSDAWFIGFFDQNGQRYTFVSNLSDKIASSATNKLPGSTLLKPIIIKILNNYFTK
jgi:beta-lactamase class D